MLKCSYTTKCHACTHSFPAYESCSHKIQLLLPFAGVYDVLLQLKERKKEYHLTFKVHKLQHEFFIPSKNPSTQPTNVACHRKNTALIFTALNPFSFSAFPLTGQYIPHISVHYLSTSYDNGGNDKSDNL